MFVRTTSKEHMAAVSAMWNKLMENNQVKLPTTNKLLLTPTHARIRLLFVSTLDMMMLKIIIN
jgi:hypothetical protein